MNLDRLLRPIIYIYVLTLTLLFVVSFILYRQNASFTPLSAAKSRMPTVVIYRQHYLFDYGVEDYDSVYDVRHVPDQMAKPSIDLS